MKTNKPNHGSGKTHFNRVKERGTSWIKARDAAVKAGKWATAEPREKHLESAKSEPVKHIVRAVGQIEQILGAASG